MQLVEDLLREPGERAAYIADPSGYLPAHGFGDFSIEDIELSLRLVADAFPPALAELLDPGAGLDSLMSIELSDVPGLFERAYDSNGDDPTALDEIVGDDDPFLDEDSGDGADATTTDVGDSDADPPDGEISDDLEAESTDFGEFDLTSTVEPLGVGLSRSSELTEIDTPPAVADDDGFDGDDTPLDSSADLTELDTASFADVADHDPDDYFE